MITLTLWLALLAVLCYGMGVTVASLVERKQSGQRVGKAIVASFAVVSLIIPSGSALAAGNGNGIEVITPITVREGLNQACLTHSPEACSPLAWLPLQHAPLVELFINAPIHNAPAGTYDLKKVPLQYDVKFAVCGNYPTDVRVIGRFDQNGGKHSNLTGTSESDWKKLHNEFYSTMNCGASFCFAKRSFSGSVDLSSLNKNAHNTTLQLVAKVNRFIKGQPNMSDEISHNDPFISTRNAHGVNLWINLPKATPTPTPTMTPTPTPTPTPTMTPTPTPTPSTTPTPTPEPEKDKGLRVEKTDNKEVTRPGHTLTYTIEVENTGDVDLHDVVVTDNVPEQLVVASVANGGKLNGSDITWNLTLGAGETKTVSFVAKIKNNTPNGHILHNVVTAESKDHDLKDKDDDNTRVEKPAQVAAVVNVPVQPVPVTATTGAAGMTALASLLTGALGLAYSVRKW